MKSRASNDMNDEDIARVFDAHDVDVPAALDDRILKAARQSGTASADTNETSRYPRKNWLVPTFAIAATVMLTVAIAPLLIQSPDAGHLSTSGESDVAVMAPPADDAVVSNETTRSSTAAISEEVQATELADINTTARPEIVLAEQSSERTEETVAETSSAARARISAKSAARKNSAQASEAVVQQSISGGSASADASALQEIDQFRGQTINGMAAAIKSLSYDPDKPDTWLDAIRRLASENKPKMAREEFDKFRARYPDYQVDFRLDEFLQTPETQEQATD